MSGPQPEVTARSGSERHGHVFRECFISHNNLFSWPEGDPYPEKKLSVPSRGRWRQSCRDNTTPVSLHPWQSLFKNPREEALRRQDRLREGSVPWESARDVCFVSE